MTRRPSESQSVQLRRMYVEERLSTRQIAERLGLSQAAVVRLLKRDSIRRDAQVSTGGRALFVIPDGIGEEARRVIAYVNGEIERSRSGKRTEPIDLICEAAQDRLGSSDQSGSSESGIAIPTAGGGGPRTAEASSAQGSG